MLSKKKKSLNSFFLCVNSNQKRFCLFFAVAVCSKLEKKIEKSVEYLKIRELFEQLVITEHVTMKIINFEYFGSLRACEYVKDFQIST